MSTRSRRSALGIALVATAIAIPSTLEAAKPQPPSLQSIAQFSPDETLVTERQADARVLVETGQPISLYRVNYAVNPGSPEAMALEYLNANADQLHLEFGSDDLRHYGTWSHPAGDTVRFRQHVGDVPVYGPDIAVTINRNSVVRYVVNGYQPNLDPASLNASLSPEVAQSAALAALGSPSATSFLETDLVVYPGDPARLTWRTRAVPSADPVGDWEILTDAATGEIFKLVDRASYVDGNGNVFLPDPLSSAGVDYNDPGYTDGGDANTPQLDSELFNSILLDITQAGATFMLVGPYAEIVDTESPFNGTYAQSSSSWEFNRQDDAFEAANTYYHIDTIMRHFNIALGVPVEPIQYTGGARFDPHGLGGSDNSHYTSSSGVVAFGEGGVDDAEDADVVVHELGHAMHDWVTLGNLSQVNGLSEGFGDYIAASYSRAFGQWLPGDPQYNWVFDWDGHNPFWGGRRTDYGAQYPGGLTGQIHTDGQIWSTCNMLVWDAIGRDNIDRAMMTGLGFTGGNTNQEDAAQAALQAAVDLGYDSGDIAAMQSIYQGCGYDVEVTNIGLETTISGACPGPIQIEVTNATPNGRVAFGFADAAGQTTIPSGSCAGTMVGLDDPRVLTTLTADGNGEIDLTVTSQSQSCGKVMQAIDLDTCAVGNIFTVPTL